MFGRTDRAHRARRLSLGTWTLAVAAATAATTVGAPSALAALPDGRAYELVSNVDTGTDDAQTFITREPFASRDGERVAWTMISGYGDAPSNALNWYRAQRSAGGWGVEALTPGPPPGEPVNGDHPDALFPEVAGFADDLRIPIFETTFGLAAGDQDGTAIDLYARRSDGTFDWVSSGGSPDTEPVDIFLGGVSDDTSHVVGATDRQLLPADTHTEGSMLYEWVAGTPRIAGVLPDGTVHPCGAIVGDGAPRIRLDPKIVLRYAVSRDASRIVFESPDHQTRLFGGGPPCLEPTEIYQRVGGTTTIHVSASQRSTPDPNGAADKMYMSASDDGSKVLFATTESLTDDDPDITPGMDLYLYDVTTGELTRVTSGTSGHDASGFTYIVGMSRDAARVFFIADGVLAPGASAGVPNLYVWDHGTTRHVVSGTDLTLVKNALEVRGRDGETQQTANLTSSGDYLVVVGSRHFDGAGPVEAWRYDVGKDDLVCVSCRPDGADSATEVTLPVAYNNLLPRGMSLAEDGRVFFASRERLAPGDTNHAKDVYSYDDHGVHLISSGRDEQDVHFIGTSASGDDVFFTTFERLTWQDQDDASDVYDARVGGGFPEPPPVPAAGCEGDGCRAPAPAASSPLTTPTSSTPFPGSVPGRAARFRVAAVTPAALRRLARTGRVRLKISSDAAATFSAVGRSGGAVVARGTAAVRHAGRTTLTLRLRASARARLRRTGRLALRITVSSTASSVRRTVRVTVTRAAAVHPTTYAARR